MAHCLRHPGSLNNRLHRNTCRFISPSRKHRFAVMEASISMVATLLPAIEPVDFVTIMPSTKSPIGRTVLQVSARCSSC